MRKILFVFALLATVGGGMAFGVSAAMADDPQSGGCASNKC